MKQSDLKLLVSGIVLVMIGTIVAELGISKYYVISFLLGCFVWNTITAVMENNKRNTAKEKKKKNKGFPYKKRRKKK